MTGTHIITTKNPGKTANSFSMPGLYTGLGQPHKSLHVWSASGAMKRVSLLLGLMRKAVIGKWF